MNERYLVDADGNRVAVVLDIATYERLLEELEEVDATRAYDAALAEQADVEMMPLDEAITEIEAEWAKSGHADKSVEWGDSTTSDLLLSVTNPSWPGSL